MVTVGTVELNQYVSYSVGYDLLGQSVDNNCSFVRLYGVLNVTGSYVSWSSGTADVWGNVRGLNTYYSQGSYTVVQYDETLWHDSNGNYSTNLYGEVKTDYVSGKAIGTITLPHIDRIGQILTATDFNDEEDPTITYTNPGGFRINARIEVNGQVFKQIDDIDNSGSITFELTTNERNQLREISANYQKYPIRFVIATCIGGNTETNWTWLDRTLSIVNADPTFTYSVEEKNAKVVSMLGSSSGNILIGNVSELEFTFVPTTYKYSTVKSILISEGIPNNIIQSFTITSSPYKQIIDISNVTDSGKFVATTVDSRGLYSTVEDNQRTLIPYSVVKIKNYSFERESPISSNIIFNGEFIYWGNVGSYTNTPIVKYKLDNGSWITIPSTNYSIDTTNHKLSIYDYEITNILSYQSKGQFSISIEDNLTSVSDTSDNGLVLKGVPTFEAGETDFQVNGDLIIADTQRENPINVRDALSSAGAYNIATNGSEVKLPYKIDNKDVYMKRLSATKYTGTSLTIGTGVSSFTRMWIDPGQSYVRNTANNIFIALFQYGDPNDWVRAYQLGGNVTVLFGNTYNTINTEVVVTVIYQKS